MIDDFPTALVPGVSGRMEKGAHSSVQKDAYRYISRSYPHIVMHKRTI